MSGATRRHSGPLAALPFLILTLSGTSVSAGTPAAAGSIRRSPVVQVVEKVAPAVVNIATDQRVENPFGDSQFGALLRQFFEGPRHSPERKYVPNSLGSGVLVDPAGYLITNEHVIQRASRIRVTLKDGRTVVANVVGTDTESDLAVLKLTAAGPFPAVELGHSKDLMIGETVVAIGNPYGFSSSVTTGVISAVGRTIETGDRVFTDYIQTDALINPGNSGGPLLNIQGELIGVNNAVYAPAQGIGFAIPVDRIRRVVQDLIAFGEVRHPWYGFILEEDRPDGGGPDDLVRLKSVHIQRIFIGSPADNAGLVPGDRIRSIAGRPVHSRGDVNSILSSIDFKTPVPFQVERGDRSLTVTVRSAPFPGDKALDYFREVTGMTLEEIPAGLRARYRFLPERGLMITSVRPGSQAGRLGLREGDVVIRLGHQAVGSESDLRHIIPDLLSRAEFFMMVVRGRVAYNLTFPIV